MPEPEPPGVKQDLRGSHLSIGEVLSLLLEEFPDITISKIRFLESQGLIDPERTPSGYRMFFDEDVELLRCILREQRENYLPLRVIKDRLDSGEIDPTSEQPRPKGIKNVGDDGSHPGEPAVHDEVTSTTPQHTSGVDERQIDVIERAEQSSAQARRDHPAARPGHGHGSSAARFFAGPSDSANGDDDQAPTASVPTSAPDGGDGLPVPPGGLEGSEVCALTGLSGPQLDSLVSYGVVVPMAGGARFDDSALEIATISKRLLDSGLDARHLRGWRVAADREAGLYEQLIQPLLRQRNPTAQQQAQDQLRELEGLGGQLHAALLRHALGPHLGV